MEDRSINDKLQNIWKWILGTRNWLRQKRATLMRMSPETPSPSSDSRDVDSKFGDTRESKESTIYATSKSPYELFLLDVVEHTTFLLSVNPSFTKFISATEASKACSLFLQNGSSIPIKLIREEVMAANIRAEHREKGFTFMRQLLMATEYAPVSRSILMHLRPALRGSSPGDSDYGVVSAALTKLHHPMIGLEGANAVSVLRLHCLNIY